MSLIDLRSHKKNPNKNQHSRRSLTIKSNRISTRIYNRPKYKKNNPTPLNNIITSTPISNRQADKSIVTCQNCESSYLVTNKSIEWKCVKCNIIISNAFPNIYNNIQEGIVSAKINDSFSPSVEEQMGCVIIDCNNDNEIEYNSDDNLDIQDINDLNNNHLNNNHLNYNIINYRRNISRTVSLCDMDSISTLSGLDNKINKYNNLQIDIYGNKNRYKKLRRRTHLSPNKIGINKINKTPSIPKSESEQWVFTQEYEDTYYDDDNKNNTLQSDEYSMPELSIPSSQTQSVCSQDSIIANYNHSPSMKTYDEQTRNFAIIRTKSNPHKSKKMKSKNSKWTLPLKILSEMHTWSEQNPKKRRKNPLSKQYGHHSASAIVNANNNNNKKVNAQYGYKLKASETMACDISDSAEVEYDEYVTGEYGLISPYTDMNCNVNINSNGNNTPSYNINSNGNNTPYNINSNGNNTPSYNINSNGNSTPSYNINKNGNSTPSYNINSSGNSTPSYNIFDKVSKSINIKSFSYYSNKYKYNPEIQKALQVAYLTGFNEGYMGGAAFKLTAVPPQPFR